MRLLGRIVRRAAAPLLFFVVTVGPLLMLGYYSVTLTSSALVQQAKTGAASVANTNAAYVEHRFSSLTSAQDEFGRQSIGPDLAAGNTTSLETDLDQLLAAADAPGRAFVTDATGHRLAFRPLKDGNVKTTLSTETWYRGVTAARKPFVSGLSVIGGRRDPGTVAIATPLMSGTDVIGYLVGSHPITWAQDLVSESAKSQGTSLSLVDSRGNVVVTPQNLDGTVIDLSSDDPLVGDALQGRSGVIQRQGLNGQVFSAYQVLKTLGWAIVVDVSAKAPLAAIATQQRATEIVGGALSLILLVFTLVGFLLLQRAQQSVVHRERAETMQRLDEAALTVHSRRGQEALDSLAVTARELAVGDFSGLAVFKNGDNQTVESVAYDSSGELTVESSPALADIMNGRAVEEEEEDPSNRTPVMTLPLLAGSEVLGRLVVARKPGSRPFDEVKEALLRQIALHAVTAITKKRQDEERESFLEELRDTNDELELASRFKSEFLANMSHELRTPLSAIIGFSDLLMDGADGDLNEDQAEDIGQIQRAGRSLLGLINDILDLSKIEAGRMTLEVAGNDILAIIRDVIATVRPLADARSIYLVADTPEEMERVSCDQVRIRQVVTNLASNAIKFTTKGGVTIRCQDLGEEVEVSVLDTGIGMAPEALGKIFEQFVQAESGTTRKFGGTGLGLSISRKLIELHGGEIGVESTEGEGSRFWFRLPKASTVPAQPPQEHQLISPEPHNGGGLPWRGQTHDRILVVDDEAPVRQMISRRLGEVGFEVLEAANAEEAVKMAREFHPAAITLDIMMPKVDGWKVLRTLQADPLTADIPVVVVSIVDGKEVAMSMGAASYMTKPFSRDELLSHLQRALPAVDGADVLCIDDEASARELMARSLGQLGMRVRLASSGQEGLREIEVKIPDAIVVDLMMPEMSGFELVVRLRFRPELAAVPIIVLSARELSPEDVAALVNHIDRFISKSDLRTADLKATLRQAIEYRRSEASRDLSLLGRSAGDDATSG